MNHKRNTEKEEYRNKAINDENALHSSIEPRKTAEQSG